MDFLLRFLPAVSAGGSPLAGCCGERGRCCVIASLRQPWHCPYVLSGIWRRPWSHFSGASTCRMRLLKHQPDQTPTSAFLFASLREANGAQTSSSQRQSAGSQSQRTDLGLESPSYLRMFHDCAKW